MTNKTGEAPLCTRCSMHRDANVHLEQYRQHGYHPYTDALSVVVTFERVVEADPGPPDLSRYTDRTYDDVVDPAERAKYIAEDVAHLKAYHSGEWSFVGVRARAIITIGRLAWNRTNRSGNWITEYTLESAGVTGFEFSGSFGPEITEAFLEEKDALKRDIEALMSGPVEWKES